MPPIRPTPRWIGYDALDRLVSFVTPSTSQSFSYDAVGNRLSQTIGANTYSYTYPGSAIDSPACPARPRRPTPTMRRQCGGRGKHSSSTTRAGG